MNIFKKLGRLIFIYYVWSKYGLDKIIFSIKFLAPLRILTVLNPWNIFFPHKFSRAEAIRKTLEDLGPIFVKFGQALSTRPDIIPADIVQELAKLQDNVQPFASSLVVQILEDTYQKPLAQVFANFEYGCLASASMAQVHAARLHSGEEVVVKILRPNLRSIIKQDTALLRTFANFADKYWPYVRRFKPKEIIADFEQTLLDELDLQREASNAGQLKRNFKNSPLLHVPEIYWDYVRENVLVQEKIQGVQISDFATIDALGIDRKKLAERLISIFFTQVFRDCFFHADMHPGNIFIDAKNPLEPKYICVDFGIMGTLSDVDKRYLAENLFAFFNRDYKRVAVLHIESGWVGRNTSVAAFESAMRTVCERVFEKPLKDISFGLLILQLLQVARRFHINVQPQLVLLQKTLFAIEGLSRQLYPDLDLWVNAKPFLQKWLKEQSGPRAIFKHLRSNLPFIVEQLPYMPKLINDILILSKEEKIRALENKIIAPKNHFSWYSFGFGILFCLACAQSVVYFISADFI
jgi:ubiquinone biosynthesis protein